MVAQLELKAKSLYDTDYNLWVLDTVQKLENRDFETIDLENLSEKVYNQNHWKKEIRNFRKQIKRELKTSPSLKNYLAQMFEESYQDAKELLSNDSDLPLNTFPEKPIASLEQILDENWLP